MTEEEVMDGAIGDTMRKATGKGCECPVCGQFVKVYKRTINASMAAQLARAYKKFGDYYGFHIKDILEGEGGGADFAKLRYWKLIEELKNDDPKKKHSGRWIITDQGRKFVQNKTFCFKYALIYNGKFLDFDGDETTTIQEALGKAFDYEELMNA